MIISHKHKFIFIKTEKTAGTSMEIALSKICGDRDIITPISQKDEEARKELSGRGAQNCLIPFSRYTKSDYLKMLRNKARLEYYNHISAEEIKKYIGDTVWNSYFKFAFDRNPFDKAVSLYYWNNAQEKYKSVGDFLKSGVLGRIKSYDIYSVNKLPAVDKLYKYEAMDEAFADISERLKLDVPLKMPKYKAKSGYRKKSDYKEVLDEEAVKILKIAFAREIALLKYSF